VTSLPANVTVPVNSGVDVILAQAGACAGGPGGLAYISSGKGNQGVVVTGATCDSDGALVATVEPTGSSKKSTVVKFTSIVDGKEVVQTLVVHVTEDVETTPPPVWTTGRDLVDEAPGSIAPGVSRGCGRAIDERLAVNSVNSGIRSWVSSQTG
jgi:hypothetical protein